MEEIPITTIMAALGGMIGLVLGYVARSNRFCTLSAVETAYLGGDFKQIRMWVFAIAIAALGTLLLQEFALITLSGTVHLRPRIALGGPIIGGLMFGFGMAAVGTCSFGAVLRAGGGDMRGVVVALVVGAVGYMTIRGLVAPARQAFIEPISIPLSAGDNATLPSLFQQVTGFDGGMAALLVSLVVIAVLMVWCLRDRAFTHNPTALWGSIAVGLLVVAGWFVTGHIGADEFNPQPVESITFVSATSAALIYVMTFTGDEINFPVGLFLGVLGGSFLAAWRSKELRLDAFDDVREMRRHLLGAVLMGVGGVFSMGCSLGQGLSGVSTLALPSFLALGSMWVGSAIGLHILINGWPAAFRS